MELTPELLASAGAGAIVLLAGAWSYFKNLKNSSNSQDPVLASVGVELGNREQIERLIEAVNGVKDAILDRRQAGMEDYMKVMLSKMDRLVEDRQHQGRSRRP